MTPGAIGFLRGNHNETHLRNTTLAPNPVLQDAKIAEAELEDRIALLYSERGRPVHPEVTFLSFG